MLKREDVAALAVDVFQSRFSRAPCSMGVSPGRVNLIGEHTDYNGGFVLPAAVPCYTAVAWRPRDDARVRVASHLFDKVYEAAADAAGPLGDFGDYPLGMARALGVERGFDAAIASTVPLAAGMSSSAALLLATARAVQALDGPDCTSACMETARAARRAENDFVRVPCGLMDQFIVSCARAGTACLLDCREETWEEVPTALNDARWVVVYSGFKRELTGGDYASKVRESQAAFALLAEDSDESPDALRILPTDALADACRSAAITDDAARLLRHFVTENVRVGQMRAALLAGDAGAAGAILSEGHRSLSRDFRVSLPEIDEFVRGCDAARGVQGVRITGAGFGGSLLALVSDDDAVTELRTAAAACLPREHALLEIPGFCEGATGWKL